MNSGFSNLATLKAALLASTLKNDVRFDAVIRSVGLGVAGAFANLTQRRFARVAGDTETFSADRCEFLLSRTPVEAVTKAELKLVEADGWTEQSSDFIRAIDMVSGTINTGERDVGPYYGQVRFTYTGGYYWETLEPDDADYGVGLPAGATRIPDDLFDCWLRQCRHVWKTLDKLGTDVLKDGEKAVPDVKDFAPGVQAILNQYIRYKLV